MNISGHLDDVIHRLDSSALPDVGNTPSKIVIIDAKAGAILPKRPLLSLGKDLRYYLVQPHMTVDCEGPTCRVKSFKKKRYLTLKIRYEARCAAGQEEEAVTALYHGDGPSLVLNSLITIWVEEFAREKKEDQIDICVELDTLRGELERCINRKARESAGLTLDTSLEIVEEGELEEIPLGTGEFGVRVRDCDDELRMSLETSLEVDPSRRTLALLSARDAASFEGKLKNRIRKWLVANATLNDFSHDLTNGVKKNLFREINESLEGDGRRIAFLTLASPMLKKAPALGQLPDEFVTEEHAVSCHIRDARQEITVRHRLILHLEDLGKFRLARIGRLQEWTRDKLNQITRTVFFDKRYLDVLLGDGPEEIRHRMEREAGKIGYKLQQLTVVPDLEPLSWKDGLDVEMEEKNFVTFDARVEVKLDILVSGKITNLRHDKLARYLTPEAKDIREDIRAAVLKQVQKVLHSVDPERFYMRFYHSDTLSEEPVKDVLESAIRGLLSDRFAYEDTNVVLKPRETDLTRRLEELQQGPHQLQMTIFPMREGGLREEVTLHVFFDILGVHELGWHTFCLKSKKFDKAPEHLAAIRSFLLADMRSNLENIPADYLQFSDVKIRQKLEGVMKASVDKVIYTFGVVVQFVSMRRGATAEENMTRDVLQSDIRAKRQAMIAATEADHQAATTEMNMLLLERQELIAAGVEEDDDDFETVNKRLKKLRAKIVPYPKARLPKALPQATSEGFDFDDFQQLQEGKDQYKEQLEADASAEDEDGSSAGGTG